MLRVENLSIHFGSGDTLVKAVDDVSFEMAAGETVAVVGESGSGKSVTAMGLTRLVPSPPAKYVSGHVHFDGKDLMAASSGQLRRVRGKEIAYIFQEPGSSLNPVFTVGAQIEEAIRLHRPEIVKKGKATVRDEVIRSLEIVGIRDAASRIGDYPHQMSGGMNQRVMIAMALSCSPKLLVADEPTTALDVTIQKQIIDLLRELKETREETQGMAIMLITHNFGIVPDIADRIIVMFRGKIVETGDAREVLTKPNHPYTRALIECVPNLENKAERLRTIDYEEIEAAMAKL